MFSAGLESKWLLTEVRSDSELKTVLGDLPASVKNRWHIYFDPYWLLQAEERKPEDVSVYLFKRAGQVVGYAPLVQQNWALRFRFGEITIFSYPLKKLSLQAGPVLTEIFNTEDSLKQFFDAVAANLESKSALFLEGVPTDSPTASLIQSGSLQPNFHVCRYGATYERRLIYFDSDFEGYLKSLSPRTRESLRRSQRKLLKYLDGDLEIHAVSTPGLISAFIEQAVDISRRTYQWRLLGLGLRNTARWQHTLSRMAERGWARCYTLLCKGQAVAFLIGFLYRDTFYYVDVGFDPAWSRWSVGTVLHLEVIRHLLQVERNPPRFLDFSSGGGVHKKRLSNRTREETSYLLLPAGSRGWFLSNGYRTSEAASAAVGGLLSKLHLKTLTKRIIRNQATSRAITD